ncbi:hypothetical protein CEXT_539991 [Caerostris extrusa]|uniref:Uncharacterized protein n=1 Tax=Caerostris extrusa TaxID=172846 RepID=A0AAV4MLC4_CAEEX|nr:hypothetical protein CEXT_539991 [Caerostris extrusa]
MKNQSIVINNCQWISELIVLMNYHSIDLSDSFTLPQYYGTKCVQPRRFRLRDLFVDAFQHGHIANRQPDNLIFKTATAVRSISESLVSSSVH